MRDDTLSALDAATRRAKAYLTSLDRQPVAATDDDATLRVRLARPLIDRGVPADIVIEDLARDAAGGLMGSAGGRFFGWVMGGALPAALAADWLAAAWDQNAAMSACSPAAGVVEEVAGGWLKDLLGLPSGASFAFVTGCQMAHVTCLAAARGKLLGERGWDVGARGLSGAPAFRILASQHGHGSVERAVSLLGLGRGNIEPLATDAVGRIEPVGLQRALAHGQDRPVILVLQAGDIATGAFDRFEDLIPLARARGAWVHVDGAFGLWAKASPRYRHLARGVEAADSWATDGHKLLNTPFDCGYAFVAHPLDHTGAMSVRADYLSHSAEARDPLDWNPDWSRRARGFPTYAAVRSLGRSGVADLFDRCCAHARDLMAGLRPLPGVEVVSEPIVNQALVRFLHPAPGASKDDHDRRTDQVIAAIARSGEAFFSASSWDGRRVMRISVCNWRTSSQDVERARAAVAAALTTQGGG